MIDNVGKWCHNVLSNPIVKFCITCIELITCGFIVTGVILTHHLWKYFGG